MEFLIHGLKYAFPARRGELTRGVPTSHAAPPLNKHIAQGGDPPPRVGVPRKGISAGSAWSPWTRRVPAAALRDERSWSKLLQALIDALRDGRARERTLAEKELAARLRRLGNARSQSRPAGSFAVKSPATAARRARVRGRLCHWIARHRCGGGKHQAHDGCRCDHRGRARTPRTASLVRTVAQDTGLAEDRQ